MAAGTLRLLFSGPHDVFAGTSPQGSNLQAFVVEFIITFYLMFIISGVATDNRAVSSTSFTFNILICFKVTSTDVLICFDPFFFM